MNHRVGTELRISRTGKGILAFYTKGDYRLEVLLYIQNEDIIDVDWVKVAVELRHHNIIMEGVNGSKDQT